MPRFHFQLRRWRHTFHHCAIERLPIPPHEQIRHSILFAHDRTRTCKIYSHVTITQKGLEPSPPHPYWVALFRFELLRYLQRENYTAVRPLRPLGVTQKCVFYALSLIEGDSFQDLNITRSNDYSHGRMCTIHSSSSVLVANPTHGFCSWGTPSANIVSVFW